ncbi:hypothetical protein [Pseudomonas sp. LRF_L74]
MDKRDLIEEWKSRPASPSWVPVVGCVVTTFVFLGLAAFAYFS